MPRIPGSVVHFAAGIIVIYHAIRLKGLLPDIRFYPSFLWRVKGFFGFVRQTACINSEKRSEAPLSLITRCATYYRGEVCPDDQGWVFTPGLLQTDNAFAVDAAFLSCTPQRALEGLDDCFRAIQVNSSAKWRCWRRRLKPTLACAGFSAATSSSYVMSARILSPRTL